jgi:hypothetical protein
LFFQTGGTTDIAVHEITGLDTLKEIHPPCGGHWGGITVNKEFYDFLVEIFGDKVIDAIKEKTPNSYFTLLHAFEHSKTTFKVEDVADPEGKKTIRIPLDWILFLLAIVLSIIFFWPLYCRSFFDHLPLLMTPLVSTNFFLYNNAMHFFSERDLS